MSAMQLLLTEHIDIWTAADSEKKSGRGRASGNAGSVYGVKKLRELILELAVRGKLVPQDLNDEPASELLKRIQAEKSKLVAEGKIKKEKPLESISEDEKFFELPSRWEWVRVGSLGNWGAGATPLRSVSSYYGGTMPWFKSGELIADFIDTAEETVTDLALKDCSLRLNQPGDVLLAMYGATIGKASILKIAGTTNQAVCACTPNGSIFNRYLLLMLKAMKSNFVGQGAGGAQPNISREKIIATLTALPPLAEQHRIVAKVDELMALCDQLEQQHSNAQEAHETLVSQLLATLTQSQNAVEFNTNWQRIYAHFDVLFTTEASIEALKQTLLQLAVMGKLVPQDANDEPASELLKRIQAEKAKLIAEGKLKKEKPLAPISEDEKPFELSMGWEWARFEALLTNASVGLDRGKSQQNHDLKYAYFKMNNIKNEGGYDYTNLVRVNACSEELERFKLVDGDFLFNTRNSRELVGKTCVIRDLPEKDIIYNNNILRVQFLNLMEPEFIDNWFRSESGSQNLDNLKSNTTNVCAIYQGNLFNYLCPVAPKAEQHRLVAKVDALMAICDQLKTRIQQANQQQQAIANALVAQAIA